MRHIELEQRLLDACRRLTGKGFLNSPADSFSLRIPGHPETILVSGQEHWRQTRNADIQTVSIAPNTNSGPLQTWPQERVRGTSNTLHAWIYQVRPDVGAVALSSPKGARLLVTCGGSLPPIFDEQVRHIGPPSKPFNLELHREEIEKSFSRGANVALLGEQLLCLGMTCDRVLFNTELYEKCARAYAIARASGAKVTLIPSWVRLIANRRLMKDERKAALSYSEGRIPEDIRSY